MESRMVLSLEGELRWSRMGTRMRVVIWLRSSNLSGE